MADPAKHTSPGRRFSLLISGLSVALVIGGGLLMLLFFLALGFSNWVRSQPEPTVFLMGDSMPPTLQNFDVVYLRPASELRRGTIISYSRAGSAVSHRIVGLPGETVAVHNGQVLIGPGPGALPLDEPYVRYPNAAWSADPITLGAEEYLTLGDNRAAVSGRAFHMVPRNTILGVVYRIIFPPWRRGFLEQ